MKLNIPKFQCNFTLLQLRVLLEVWLLALFHKYFWIFNNKTRLTLQIESAVIVESSYYRRENGQFPFYPSRTLIEQGAMRVIICKFGTCFSWNKKCGLFSVKREKAIFQPVKCDLFIIPLPTWLQCNGSDWVQILHRNVLQIANQLNKYAIGKCSKKENTNIQKKIFELIFWNSGLTFRGKW